VKNILKCSLFGSIFGIILEGFTLILTNNFLILILITIGCYSYTNKRLKNKIQFSLRYIDNLVNRFEYHFKHINVLNLLVLIFIIFYLIMPILNIKIGYKYVGIYGANSFYDGKINYGVKKNDKIFGKGNEIEIEVHKNYLYNDFEDVDLMKFYFYQSGLAKGFKYKDYNMYTISNYLILIFEIILYAFTHFFILTFLLIFIIERLNLFGGNLFENSKIKS